MNEYQDFFVVLVIFQIKYFIFIKVNNKQYIYNYWTEEETGLITTLISEKKSIEIFKYFPKRTYD